MRHVSPARPADGLGAVEQRRVAPELERKLDVDRMAERQAWRDGTSAASNGARTGLAVLSWVFAACPFKLVVGLRARLRYGRERLRAAQPGLCSEEMTLGHSARRPGSRLACGAAATCLAMAPGCSERMPDRDGVAPITTASAAGLGSLSAQPGAPPGSAAASEVGSETAAAHGPRAAAHVTLLAGGDVNFGQLRGQELLRDPTRNDFAPLGPLLASADLRFVNLESPLSEQHGQTVSPANPLVFTGPPAGADVLGRAGIDLVSFANNHAWDYGPRAFEETLGHLERVGVAYVGAGRSSAEAHAPRMLERHGLRIAFLAVTDIWNQPALPTEPTAPSTQRETDEAAGEARSPARYPGSDHVAGVERKRLLEDIGRTKSRSDVDVVVLSYHGGDEYVDAPREGVRRLLRAAVEAGADVVVGHHPHVVQRVEIVNGRPIFYSLGNLLMRMASGRPWTELGVVARIELARGGVQAIALCPVRIHGLEPVPLAADATRSTTESFFRTSFERLLGAGERTDPASAVELGPFGPDGCAPLRPRVGSANSPGAAR
jgi:poly-gamma-glutamate capsule biosynthesis protein CapA/YwtB (metallophosphatase superfamily)